MEVCAPSVDIIRFMLFLSFLVVSEIWFQCVLQVLFAFIASGLREA